MQQEAVEKKHRLSGLAVLADQHLLVATRAEGGEVKYVEDDATRPQLSAAHNIVAHDIVCSDIPSMWASLGLSLLQLWLSDGSLSRMLTFSGIVREQALVSS